MADCMSELAHVFCQRGEPMRKQRAEHPPAICDMSTAFPMGLGRKVRSDAVGVVAPAGRAPTSAMSTLIVLRRKQTKAPWRVHQSVPLTKRGKCSWKQCPGLTSGAKRKRGSDTLYHCEECSAVAGADVYFCNNVHKGEPQLCHLAYHNRHCSHK